MPGPGEGGLSSGHVSAQLEKEASTRKNQRQIHGASARQGKLKVCGCAQRNLKDPQDQHVYGHPRYGIQREKKVSSKSMDPLF